MNENSEIMDWKDEPQFIEKAWQLKEYLSQRTLQELQELWKCSDTLALQNYERLAQMDLTKRLSCAIFSYEGIQYQYMAPQVMEERQLQYIQEHVRILSGMYGILRPMDGVTPYRLEMQAKLADFDVKNLYDFWKDSIYQSLADETNSILNLASKEYSKCVERYQKEPMQIVTCVFGELNDGKVKEKGTYAKMARGEMVRFLADRNAIEVESAKEFQSFGFSYDQNRSTKNQYVFIR